MDKEICNKIKYLIGKGKSEKEIAGILKITESKLKEFIDQINSKKEEYTFINGNPTKKTFWEIVDKVFYVENNSGYIRLLLLSDTHLGSEEDRPDILEYLASKIADRGVFAALHSGDVFNGPPIANADGTYPKCMTLKEQVDYGKEIYHFPCKTYIVGGNHDEWWFIESGFDILQIFSEAAENIVYLGGSNANLQIGNLKINLTHGHKNGIYKSNSPACYLNEISKKFKPDILQAGHIHKASYEQIGRTHVFKTGGLQDLTEHARNNGGNGVKSVWWVNVYFDDNGNVRKIDRELETFTLKRMV